MTQTTQKIKSDKKILSWQMLLPLATILVLTLITYWNVTKNGFTDWDDDIYVVNSQLIKSLSLSDIVIYFKSITANLYTPLVTVSYAIDYKLFGLDPNGYHLSNLLLHLVNISLVYVFIVALTEKKVVAIVVTLLFAIHPLNVETVAWISSRKDLLFTLFYLLGLITYLKYLSSEKVFWFLGANVLFVLSCFAKPIAITFPFVILALDYYRFGDVSRSHLFQKTPMFIISICFIVLGFYLVSEVNAIDTLIEGYSVFDMLCLAAYSFTHYVFNGIFPADISNFHSFPHKEGSFLSFKYLISPVVVLVVLYILYRLRKQPKLIFGLLVFGLTIGPTLRLVPAGYPVAADRYFYLPSIGLFLMVGWCVSWLLQRKESAIKYGVIIFGLFVVFAFSRISYNRVDDWNSSITLWKSALKNDPTLHLAHTHLGQLYDNAGNKNLALTHYDRALKIYPDNPKFLNSASVILLSNGNIEKAKLYLDKAIELDISSELPFYNRGNIFKLQRKFDEAISDYDNAVDIKPEFAEALNNRGTCKILSGDTLGAYQDFKKASNLSPSNKLMVDNYNRINQILTQEQILIIEQD